jgi:tRNA modification GTPase
VKDMKKIEKDIQTILAAAQQGVILREGLNIAIAGKPNAGKSSLNFFNLLLNLT